jgi:antimicrobial peptide system SdpA family protein
MKTSSAVLRHDDTAPDSTPTPGGGRTDLRLGRRTAMAALLALVAVVYVLHAALPATPFQLPYDQQAAIRSVLPEGWAFFTISPRTPDVAVYGARGGGWRQLTGGTHSSPGTLLGLNRLARSQGTEVAIVANQVPPDAWTDCDREPVDCLSTLDSVRTVRDFSSHHSICGPVGLVMQEVRPWAWRNLNTVMPSRVVRVVVTC